jgi:diadenosine tetraphosphatase ApaH/serine/threonine PP2A family protein phosphatase
MPAAPLLAIFADVHANLEALEAVLVDMDALSITRRVCLGDTVGYGASPSECLELVRGLGCPVVKGNHDDATAGDADLWQMRDAAQCGVLYAREKLSPEQRAYLAALPLNLSLENVEFVHASLHAPAEWDYIMRETEARDHFTAQTQRLCFIGHTHLPMVWHLSNTGNIKSSRGHERIQLSPGGKTVVNVGSVGQPRDLQPAACYVIYDREADAVEFRRVKYDIAKASRKILRANLPHSAAQRLLIGK